MAELPTCQKTLHSLAPLVRSTLLADPVVRVESVWMMKTDSGLFPPSSVTVPFSSSGDLAGPIQTPAVRVRPARSAVVVASKLRFLAFR